MQQPKEVYTDLLMQCTREVWQAGYHSTDFGVSIDTHRQRVQQCVAILNPSVPAVLIEMAGKAVEQEEVE